MKTLGTVAILVLSAGAATARPEVTSVTFEWIRMSETIRALSANDMSPDGRYVVGQFDSNNDPAPDGTYIWDSVLNVATYLPAEGIDAVAVSDDGSVVLGDILDPEFDFAEAAAMWTSATGWQSLGALPQAGMCPSVSSAYELSADGSIAIGLSWVGCSGRGFKWTASEGMQELEALANGGNRATVVSADGMVIAGFAQGLSTRTPAAWDGATLDGSLVSPPFDGSPEGEVLGMRDDGTVLLGTQYMGGTDFRYDAVKWVNGGAPEVVGGGSMLTGWAGQAMDIADDGTIVGFDFLQGFRRAWIQPDGAGALQELRVWALMGGAVIPQGLTLEVPQAISRDGRIIVGHGFGTGAWRLIVSVTGCPGDANADGEINFDDLNILLGSFNTMGENLPADFDGNGVVDFGDLNTLLGVYNEAC